MESTHTLDMEKIVPVALGGVADKPRRAMATKGRDIVAGQASTA
jgi:hypothetical protein